MTSHPMLRLTIAAVFGLLIAACASPPTVTPPAPDASAGPTADPKALPLTVALLNTEVGVGLQRISFQLKDAKGVMIYDGDVQAAFYTDVGDKRSRQASGPAVFFGESLSNGGTWVVYSPFDSSGPWELEVTATRSGGIYVGSAKLNVIGHPKGPAPGEAFDWTTLPLPKVAGDLAAITSDPTPDAGLYGLTVAEAAASKKQTLLLFASPKYCPTALCRSALAEFKETKKVYGERLNFLHIESRDLTDPTRLSPVMSALGLSSEPWLFVLNKRGVLSMRIEGALDRVELELLIKRELGE